MCQLGRVNYTSQNRLPRVTGRAVWRAEGVSREPWRETRGRTWAPACGLLCCPDSGAWGRLLVPPASPASGQSEHFQVRDEGWILRTAAAPRSETPEDVGSALPLGSPAYSRPSSVLPALCAVGSLERPLHQRPPLCELKFL